MVIGWVIVCALRDAGGDAHRVVEVSAVRKRMKTNHNRTFGFFGGGFCILARHFRSVFF